MEGSPKIVAGQALRWLEVAFWVLGISLVAFYLAGRTHAVVASQQDLATFERARIAAVQQAADTPETRRPADADDSWPEIPEPNQSNWASGRITDYEDSLEKDMGLPEAVLRIPTIDLTVPVYNGTSELNLNRGAGRIEGTAAPGEIGNLGIAGHRDGFFRVLKDVNLGDKIELQTLSGSLTYEISEFMLVEPEDGHVLLPTEEHTITLVTCYPFYFVGHAPQRFIVRGELME